MELWIFNKQGSFRQVYWKVFLLTAQKNFIKKIIIVKNSYRQLSHYLKSLCFFFLQQYKSKWRRAKMMILRKAQVSGGTPARMCFLWTNSEFRGLILSSCGIMLPLESTGVCVDDFWWSHKRCQPSKENFHSRFHSVGTHMFYTVYKLLMIK